MIRLLLYGLSPNLGGIERYLHTLVGALAGPDFHFDVVHSDTGKPPALRDELATMGCNFYPVTPRSANARRNRRELQSLMSERTFDLLHFNATSASYLAPVRAALRNSIPVLIHSHSAGGPPSARTRAFHSIGRVSPVMGSTRRIAVSEPAGRWMFGRRSWEVVENGFDSALFRFNHGGRTRVRSELGLSNRLVIGHVGAFLPAKNHDFLLGTFAEIARLRPDAMLVLVGEGPGEAEARTRVTSMGLKDRVAFLGRRADVADLLSAMDVFIFPSIYEGSPLSVAEARAAGTPAVVSEAVPRSMSGQSTRRLPLSAGHVRWAEVAVELGEDPRRTPLSSGLPTVAEHSHMMSRLYRQVTSIDLAISEETGQR